MQDDTRHAIICSMNIAAMAKYFINLFYPLHCPACRESIDPLSKTGVCGSCSASIRRNPRPYCRSCGRPVNHQGDKCGECAKLDLHFDRAYSACLYEERIKELVHKFKYGSGSSLAPFFSKIMLDFLGDNREIARGVEAVTYVPLDNRRLRERGFNQSRLLARGVAGEIGAPLIDTLKKIAPTKHQNELSREERLMNLRGAFRARRDVDLAGKIIILVDDVMTTGATLSECSKALRDAGAKEVRCLTLARGV